MEKLQVGNIISRGATSRKVEELILKMNPWMNSWWLETRDLFGEAKARTLERKLIRFVSYEFGTLHYYSDQNCKCSSK